MIGIKCRAHSLMHPGAWLAVLCEHLRSHADPRKAERAGPVVKASVRPGSVPAR